MASYALEELLCVSFSSLPVDGVTEQDEELNHNHCNKEPGGDTGGLAVHVRTLYLRLFLLEGEKKKRWRDDHYQVSAGACQPLQR